MNPTLHSTAEIHRHAKAVLATTFPRQSSGLLSKRER